MGVRFGFGENIQYELNQVHAIMAQAYDFRAYQDDVKRAAQMETILRKIKSMRVTQDKDQNNIESVLDEQCYDIAKKAFSNLKTISRDDLKAKRLFMTTHGTGYELGKQMGVDDIVEAELSSVIQSIQALAFSNNVEIDNLDFLSNTTGRVKGNLIDDAQKLMENITEDAVQGVINKINNTNFRNKPYIKLVAKLKDTQAKSIKTDVISFNADLVAELDPAWDQFSVFAGANFTVKNYISKRKNDVAVQIHFGESNPYKSIMAQLTYLGFSVPQSKRIFYHSLNSWLNSKAKSVEIHIPHIRFAYELQGNGLYDADGDPISGADFLIVNDPISENIYVRSTKAMVAAALRRELQDPAPFTSSQYILYGDLVDNNF